jgi:hypothetical protein
MSPAINMMVKNIIMMMMIIIIMLDILSIVRNVKINKNTSIGFRNYLNAPF